MSVKQLTAAQLQAYQNLNIHPNNRIIISLDGGGIRGILTVQLLKKIEEIAGLRIGQFCDMVAGTSTGAIIAGLIASGKSAVEIEGLYKQLVSKVFLKRDFLANRFANPPSYDKKNYRAALKATLNDVTLAEVCSQNNIDIFITSKDLTDNEETFFTCFNNNGIKGTYQNALLRIVMEATMSAPTYFSPLERFIDGGVTTYNNPALAALMEATRYDGRGKYEMPNVTLLSLGTGETVKSFSAAEAANPSGPDVYFWLNYVMNASSDDAASMQNDFFRSGLMAMDYRRYQISFDAATMAKLPNRDITALHFTNANSLHALTDGDLDVQMDDTTKFDLMAEIGGAMTDYIMQKNKFKGDLNDTPSKRDELITSFNGVPQILPLVTSATWIDNTPTG